MARSTSEPHQRAASLPAARKLHRTIFALCIALAPLVVLLSFIVDPTDGVPQGAEAIFSAFRTATPLRIQLFLLANTVAVYLFPLSYIGLGWLAMPRAPWLATLGTISGLAGTLPWALFVPLEALAAVMARLGDRAAFVTVWDNLSAEGVIVTLFILWIVGHLLGFVLLGIALGRAQVIPGWAAGLILASVPLQMVAYPTYQGIWQQIGFALVFLGSIPAAGAMLKTPYDHTLVHADTQPTSAV